MKIGNESINFDRVVELKFYRPGDSATVEMITVLYDPLKDDRLQPRIDFNVRMRGNQDSNLIEVTLYNIEGPEKGGLDLYTMLTQPGEKLITSKDTNPDNYDKLKIRMKLSVGYHDLGLETICDGFFLNSIYTERVGVDNVIHIFGASLAYKNIVPASKKVVKNGVVIPEPQKGIKLVDYLKKYMCTNADWTWEPKKVVKPKNTSFLTNVTSFFSGGDTTEYVRQDTPPNTSISLSEFDKKFKLVYLYGDRSAIVTKLLESIFEMPVNEKSLPNNFHEAIKEIVKMAKCVIEEEVSASKTGQRVFNITRKEAINIFGTSTDYKKSMMPSDAEHKIKDYQNLVELPKIGNGGVQLKMLLAPEIKPWQTILLYMSPKGKFAQAENRTYSTAMEGLNYDTLAYGDQIFSFTAFEQTRGGRLYGTADDNGNYIPNSAIVFNIISVTHTGSTHTKDWYTMLETDRMTGESV
jgi:hypothetical protein